MAGQKYYMILQGMLRACHERSGFLASFVNALHKSEPRNVTWDEYRLFVESCYVDCIQLKEHLMGAMKAIQPDLDIPFNTTAFIRSAKTEGEQSSQ